jgi:acyl-coenzyme A thioesterase PaaI-like protein
MTQSSVGKRFGVIDDDQQRALSGLEFVQGLVDGTLPLNAMAETLGYDIVEVAKGRVVASATPHAGHRNPAGTVQSMLDKGFAQTTLEFKISLVRPITPQTGLVKAEGKVISCGRRVGTAEGKLTDKDGRVLAHGTTTCLIYAH